MRVLAGRWRSSPRLDFPRDFYIVPGRWGTGVLLRPWAKAGRFFVLQSVLLLVNSLLGERLSIKKSCFCPARLYGLPPWSRIRLRFAALPLWENCGARYQGPQIFDKEIFEEKETNLFKI